MYLPALRKGGKREGPVHGAYKPPCVTAATHSCTSRGGGGKGLLPLGGALLCVL
jgi:hypothetical protein